MSDRHRQQWEELGRVDPYWAVISEPGKKGGRWDPEDFFASGANEIRAVLARAAALGIDPGSGDDFLARRGAPRPAPWFALAALAPHGGCCQDCA